MSRQDDTKERIVQSARERFFTSGFSKVTMDELAQQLGLSKKTMYEHFRSKDELIDAVVQLQMDDVSGKIKEIMHSSQDFITKIYHLWEFIGQMVCHISVQFRDDVRRFRPDVWIRIEDLRRKVILANFSRMIDEGVRMGLVRSDMNRDVMVLMYLSAVQGVVNPEILAQNSFSIQEAFRTIMAVYLDGILTEAARKQFHSKISHHQEALHS